MLLVSVSKALSADIFVSTVIDFWLFEDIHDTSKAKNEFAVVINTVV